MKDDDCVHQIFNLLLIFKEKVFHLLRVIDVYSSLYMSALIFIVEAAINDQILFVVIS